MNEVKTTELREDLLHMRSSFADWDNERRKRVDIVLEAISTEEEYVNLDHAQNTLQQLRKKLSVKKEEIKK